MMCITVLLVTKASKKYRRTHFGKMVSGEDPPLTERFREHSSHSNAGPKLYDRLKRVERLEYLRHAQVSGLQPVIQFPL